MKTIRIGAGAGFAGDRIDPAVELAKDGRLDYLIFECLAERTIALAQLNKRQGRSAGFDPLLRARLEATLPFCASNGTRIITNMGAANPEAAAHETVRIARELGLHGLRVAFVAGDDVFDVLHSRASTDSPLVRDPREKIISANAYLGMEPIVECLRQRADVVITGRAADPSLFLAAMVHEFQWALDDWHRLGQGTAVGHLLECAGQLTGGYFADPVRKDVAGLDRLGFPIAEVSETGEAILSKLDGAGGALSISNCKEQILYEVHNPSRYVTPDVTADFMYVQFTELAIDKIRVSGASGSQRPESLKVSVGMYTGFIADGQISYAGPGALARARLSRQILEKRLSFVSAADLRFDFIGADSSHGPILSQANCEPWEVRLRAAGRFFDEAEARRLMQEVESLYVNGPAGGAGIVTSLRENIAIEPTLLPRHLVSPTTTIEVA